MTNNVRVEALLRGEDREKLEAALGLDANLDRGTENAEWVHLMWESVDRVWDIPHNPLVRRARFPFILCAGQSEDDAGLILVSEGDEMHYAPAVMDGGRPVPYVRVTADGEISPEHEMSVRPMMQLAYRLQRKAGVRWLATDMWPEDPTVWVEEIHESLEDLARALRASSTFHWRVNMVDVQGRLVVSERDGRLRVYQKGREFYWCDPKDMGLPDLSNASTCERLADIVRFRRDRECIFGLPNGIYVGPRADRCIWRCKEKDEAGWHLATYLLHEASR